MGTAAAVRNIYLSVSCNQRRLPPSPVCEIWRLSIEATIAPLSARSMTIVGGDHGGGALLLFLVARYWVSPFVTLVRQRATPTRWMRLPHLASRTTALPAKALRSRKALGHTAVTSSSRLCFSLAVMLDPCFPSTYLSSPLVTKSALSCLRARVVKGASSYALENPRIDNEERRGETFLSSEGRPAGHYQ